MTLSKQNSSAIKLLPKGNMQVIQDNLAIIYANKEYIEGHVNITNPGTPEALTFAYLTLKKIPPANAVLRITPVRQENGVFDVKNAKAIKHNICQYIKQDKILYPGFIKYGNLPRSCPIKEGEYWVKNYKVPVENIPPMIPSGIYKIIFDIGNENVRLLNLEVQGTITNN